MLANAFNRLSYLVARSAQGKSLDRRISGTLKTLDQAAKFFEHTTYDCREDAAHAVQNWQARCATQWHAVETAIHEDEQRLPRGLRKMDELVTNKRWRVTAAPGWCSRPPGAFPQLFWSVRKPDRCQVPCV